MNSTGLTKEQLDVLTQIFSKHAEVKAVKLYGSRAKGNFHPRSDIDLVVFGDNIDRFLISELLLDLDDSNLPYFVDLQNYSDLKNRALIEHIDRVGVLIYAVRGELKSSVRGEPVESHPSTSSGRTVFHGASL